MGTGSSFPHNENNLSDRPGVVKRIPIEMKPRMTLGGALRSVGSLGRHPLRSTFSVELENTEVERVQREFEMYKISKKAEMGDALKKVNKLENENRRLRAELQTLQKTCDKLRTQRDQTLDAEHQALERASCFEMERNKVQKQFKIFRESKEREIRDLLKDKEAVEKALHRLDPESLLDLKDKNETESCYDGFYNLCLPSLRSESSLDSSVHRRSLQRSLDSVETPEGCLKDWSGLSFLDTLSDYSCPVIRIYIAVSPDLSHDLMSYLKVKERYLRDLCAAKNKFLSLMTFIYEAHNDKAAGNVHEIRSNAMKTSSLCVAVDNGDGYLEKDMISCYLDAFDKAAIFVFHGKTDKTYARQMMDKGQSMIVIDDREMTLNEKFDQLLMEMANHIHRPKELGTSISPSGDFVDVHDSSIHESSCCSVPFEEINQQQALISHVECPCEVEMSRLYDRLNEYISSDGPLPPLLVLGEPGSGKSHLLARWISDHARRRLSCLVLYHFVGLPSDRSSHVINMVQRWTVQMMQVLSCTAPVTFDPSQLLEEFPHWLEKTSTKLLNGVVLVIDSGDRFHNCEENLSWLLDPIPVKSRVIISANDEACPQLWRSWPTLKIEPFTKDELTEFLQKTYLRSNTALSEDMENRLDTQCQKRTLHPLYLTVLTTAILQNVRWNEDEVIECLDCTDVEHLYRFIIQDLMVTWHEASYIIQKMSLQACLHSNASLSEDMESQLVTQCERRTLHPLYLTVLTTAVLHNMRWNEDEVTECLTCPDIEHLYRFIIQDMMEAQHEASYIIQKILCYLLVSHVGLPEHILFDLIPELSWDVWLTVYDQLEKYCLLTTKSGLLVFTNRQGRSAVQSLLASSELISESRDRLMEYYMQMLRSDAVTNHLCDELPRLLYESNNCPLLKEFLSNVDVFRSLYSRGRSDELLKFWQCIGLDPVAVTKEYFEIIGRLETASSSDTALLKNANLFEILGRFSQDLGLLYQAFSAFQKSLEILESIDPDLPSIGRCFYFIGNLHLSWGKLATAESYFKQALMNWEMNSESCHAQWVVKTLDLLAAFYKRQGKYNLVDSLIKKSISLKKIATSQNVGFKSRKMQEDIRQQMEQLEKQCEEAEGILLAKTLGNLGMLYEQLEDFGSSKEALTQCILLIETHFSVTSPELIKPLYTLASVYESENDFQQAEATYLRILDVVRRVPSEDNLVIEMVTRKLEDLHQKQGIMEPSEQLHQNSQDSELVKSDSPKTGPYDPP